MLSHLLLENFSEARLLGILLVLIGKLVLIHRELLMGYSSNYSFLNRLPLFLSFVCLFMCVWVVCVVIFVSSYQNYKGKMQIGQSVMLLCIVCVWSKNLIKPLSLRISSWSVGITARSNLFHTASEVGNFSSGFQSAFILSSGSVPVDAILVSASRLSG